MAEIDEIARCLTTKYRARLYSKFVKGIKEYKLLKPGDRVCVCISGGKDSMIMAKLFQLLHRYSDFPFDVEYVVMNPGYNDINLQTILKNLEKMKIEAHIVNTDIFEIANAQTKSPCFLCAKMRRGALYSIAKGFNCNKIALGHHYDDVIETTLMNMLSAGSFQTMLPKLHSTNFPGMELIRPMYFIREKDIISFKNANGLEFIQCACRFTESVSNGEEQSQRKKTKQLIKELLKTYSPQTEMNIFSAASNVTLDMILGYKKGGVKHSFLDEYDNYECDKE